jgi:hypothetical protein
MTKKLDDRVIQSPYHMTHSETKVVWLGSFMTQNVKTIAFGPSYGFHEQKKVGCDYSRDMFAKDRLFRRWAAQL